MASAAITWREGSTRLAFPAGSDFTSSQTQFEPTFQIVKLNGSSQAVACAAATDKAIGVIVNCPIGGIGDTADIVSLNSQGTLKVQAGGTIAVGDLLVSDSSGHAITGTQQTAGQQPTSVVIGRAITAAASGQLVEFQPFTFLY